MNLFALCIHSSVWISLTAVGMTQAYVKVNPGPVLFSSIYSLSKVSLSLSVCSPIEYHYHTLIKSMIILNIILFPQYFN